MRSLVLAPLRAAGRCVRACPTAWPLLAVAAINAITTACGLMPEPGSQTVTSPPAIAAVPAAPAGSSAPVPLAVAPSVAGAPSAGAVAPPAANLTAPTAGSAAPTAGSAAPAPVSEDLRVAPAWLSQTGLFSDISTRSLGPNVQLYAPSYQLWSDAAVKTRWVMLPPNTQIDTSDMDVWKVPVGTKLWKQFVDNGRLVETRYMAKFGPTENDWLFMGYHWNAEQTDAVAVPEGVNNADGTMHDIPGATVCKQCHNAAPMATLGFSALQLAHSEPGLTLDALTTSGRLTVAPATALQMPGDAVASQALGYLHANCGGCHNEHATQNFGVPETKVVFWQSASQLGSVEETTTYVNLVTNTHGDLTRLQHGLARMKVRDQVTQMPPLGTEVVDMRGVAIVEAWLQQLQTQLAHGSATPP